MAMKQGDNSIKIMVAGGGTGGHLYPGIAIVEQLEKIAAGVDAVFVGARGGMEERILATTHWKTVLLDAHGLRGASVTQKAAMLPRLVAALVRSTRLIRSYGPDVVLGTGGYASAAVILASVFARVPRVLQEQNSVPGLVNRRLARFADLVLLSYESSRRWLPSATRAEVIGNPLRTMSEVDRATAAGALRLDADLPTVLVVGGSRGAHSLNLSAMDAAAVMTQDRDVQFLILCGSNDHADLVARADDLRRVRVLDYLEDMSLAYAIADVAVARAGASSVFELAAFGVPSIFVPYPHAADDHQAHNVSPLAAQGAAVVISDAALDGPTLRDAVGMLLDDPTRRDAMSAAIRTWARPRAAIDAARAVVDIAKKKEPAPAMATWECN